MVWSAQVEVRVAASRTPVTRPTPPPEPQIVVPVPRKKAGKEQPAAELPPALVAMIEERMADEREAAEAARLEAIVVLPPSTWHEIQTRAASIGVTAELLDEGSQLVLVTEAPTPDA